MPKVRVVDGKLFIVRRLADKITRMGYPVSPQCLDHIFAGRRNPRHLLFKAMAKALGLSLDETDKLIQRIRRGEYQTIGI